MEISQHVRAIISFIEVANAQSFSGAARKLGISAAAVSKNVAALELVLGVRLMNRTTRKISLTEEGESFLSQASIALEMLDSAVDNIVMKKLEVSGRVRISTSSAFGREQLLPVLPELSRRYPRISVEIDFDDRVTDIVKDGYDLAIRGGRIIDSTLITRSVCPLKTVLVASPEYLSKYGVPETPADLRHHRLIARRFLGGRINPWQFKNPDGSVISIDPEPAALTLSAPEAIAQAAKDGLGIAQVGAHHAITHLKSKQLHVVLFELYDSGDYELVLQYPHRSFIAPRVRATVDFLLDAFKQDDSLHYSWEQLNQYKYKT